LKFKVWNKNKYKIFIFWDKF